MQKFILILLIVMITTFGVVSLVWADNGFEDVQDQGFENCGGDNELCNPLGTSNVSSIVGRIIKAFLGIIGTISLIMFIYGGLMMLTSAGKAEQIKKGQQTLVWASLGILIVFASYAILKFVFSVVGL